MIPAWLAKAGSAMVRGLGVEDAAKYVAWGVLAVLGIIITVVVMLPAMILHIPVMAIGQVVAVFDAAVDAGQAHGLEVPWQEVAAVWAALDAYGRPLDMGAVAAAWVERRTRTERYTDAEGDERSRTVTSYHLRSMDRAIAHLELGEELAEQARRYLIAIRHDNRPPPGWIAAADTPWQAWPVPGHSTAAAVSSGYGIRISPISERPEMHDAVDIAAPAGTPVVAAWAGTVTEAARCRVRGRFIIVQGAGKLAEYRHLSQAHVSHGQRVAVGQQIGTVGQTGEATGPHLCFAVSVGGGWANPLSYY